MYDPEQAGLAALFARLAGRRDVPPCAPDDTAPAGSGLALTPDGTAETATDGDQS